MHAPRARARRGLPGRTAPAGRAAVGRAAASLLALAVLALAAPLRAGAVSVPVADAPLSNAVNATTTYVAHGATTQNNEQVPQAVFTFPANTDLSGVSAATVTVVKQPGGVPYTVNSVVVDQVARTVTVNIAFPKDRPTETFDVSVGGVMNPSQPGSYAYSVLLASTKTAPTTVTRTYALVAGTTAVTVGAAALSTDTAGAAVALSFPITVGPAGRLAGTTAAGGNTITVTFPVGYTVPASPPATSVTLNGSAAAAVTVAGRVVTITLPAGVTIPNGGTVTVALASAFGLSNPAAGSYSLTASTSAQTGPASGPSFSIVAPQYLTLSVDATGVALGTLVPETPSAPFDVHVTVGCDGAYVISRSIAGTVAEMGLTIAGDASGTKVGGGTSTFTDTYTAVMPWSTDPGTALTVTVQYTVVRS